MDVAKLKALTLTELNDITELGVSAADLSDHPGLVDTVRDSVIYANESDLWDVPRRRPEYVHEIADQLTSNYTGARAQHHHVVTATWATRVAEFEPYAGRYDQWVNTDLADLTRTSPDVNVGRALYLAYTHATNKLVDWLIDNQPEDDDETETPA